MWDGWLGCPVIRRFQRVTLRNTCTAPSDQTLLFYMTCCCNHQLCVCGVQALPTLLLFREGRAVDRVEGFMAQAPLAKRVRYYAGRMDKKFGRQ